MTLAHGLMSAYATSMGRGQMEFMKEKVFVTFSLVAGMPAIVATAEPSGGPLSVQDKQTTRRRPSLRRLDEHSALRRWVRVPLHVSRKKV
ncbi:hypothetical protein LZC95_29540 [Pendulispora brunnea]|uniref:Uncharacterized protein n=1 Tax=Pendulispora brunnea TaxID=2905690 RepID=A0ABZ2JVU2_9BACT